MDNCSDTFFKRDFLFSDSEMNEVILFAKDRLSSLSLLQENKDLDKDKFNKDFNDLCKHVATYIYNFKKRKEDGGKSLIKSDTFDFFMSNFQE